MKRINNIDYYDPAASYHEPVFVEPQDVEDVLAPVQFVGVAIIVAVVATVVLLFLF